MLRIVSDLSNASALILSGQTVLERSLQRVDERKVTEKTDIFYEGFSCIRLLASDKSVEFLTFADNHVNYYTPLAAFRRLCHALRLLRSPGWYRINAMSTTSVVECPWKTIKHTLARCTSIFEDTLITLI